MIILGIESSCDETSASLLSGHGGKIKILSQITASQIKTHRQYGGVVPEVAARQHVINIIPVIEAAVSRAKIAPGEIEAIAVTSGPGLITSLRVGVQTAKTLSLAWNKKLIRVNHIEGHIYANWLKQKKPVKLPALCLVVSGGHTELILVKKHGDYRLIGRTRDDAAGEAFDKVAKLLKIGYPGGPRIQALAKKGDPDRFDFPRPMLNYQNYDFSFSGLKTAVLYLVKKEFKGKKIPINDVCAGFQQAVVEVLTAKTVRAAKDLKVKSVLLAGGVAANQPLRQQLGKALKKELPKVNYHIPLVGVCTDNAAMIAIAGYFHALKKDFTDWHTLDADPNWELV